MHCLFFHLPAFGLDVTSLCHDFFLNRFLPVTSHLYFRQMIFLLDSFILFFMLAEHTILRCPLKWKQSVNEINLILLYNGRSDESVICMQTRRAFIVWIEKVTNQNCFLL